MIKGTKNEWEILYKPKTPNLKIIANNIYNQ